MPGELVRYMGAGRRLKDRLAPVSWRVLAIVALACIVLPGIAFGQTEPQVVTPAQAQPPSSDELRRMREELQALKDEAEAAKAAEAERAKRIDRLAEQLGAADGGTMQVTPAKVDLLANPPPANVPGKTSPGPEYWGGFEPGKGVILMRSDVGEVDLGLVSYLRYLNQHGMDDTYTSAFGQPFDVTPREDFQLAKVQITLRGWLFDPKFGYNAYVWTSQASQGLPAQVVAAGNINWTFDPALRVFFGIHSVPSTRSTNRTFPYWLRNDSRPIADEFFRGSYTQGIWAEGTIMRGLDYRVMLANNLSALGVQAKQLDANPNTFSAALTWTPSTGEFGPGNGFGDYEEHQELATLFSAHYTSSTEDAQSQPGTDSIENTQIRLSDGTLLFNATAFGTGRITQTRYQMAALDAAAKYKGLALEFEYYSRWLDDFKVEGVIPYDDFYDQGFTLQASAMAIPKTLQAYIQYSKVFGEFGDPYDLTVGINYFPLARKDLRVNVMGLWVENSPVGYTAYPVPVGGNGFTFLTDFALTF
ncbi:MAG TPA: hypothetical protein VFV70_10685 [Hyphomonadaceae bacterium]|nr:hypothetical protein [Hyphomonadaceae bacterium]